MEVCPHCMNYRYVLTRDIKESEKHYFDIIVNCPIKECQECYNIWVQTGDEDE